MIHGWLTRADDDCVIQNISKTSNFLERMRGLLASPPLKENEGLLISPCSFVHTFGMNYAIDLVFLDKQWTIVKTVRALRPWRMAASNTASMVLELAADSLDKLQLTTGLQLEWHDDL
jgi:uncharacterized membrane protein (UPF0127 family)